MCESPFGLLSTVVVVGQIVSYSLSILHERGEDRLQEVELPKKIQHNSTVLLTASGNQKLEKLKDIIYSLSGNGWGKKKTPQQQQQNQVCETK